MTLLNSKCCPKHPELGASTRKDGKCPACARALWAVWYAKNKQARRDYEVATRSRKNELRNKRRAADREATNAADRAYYHANRARILATERDYTAENKDRMLAYQRAWAAKNRPRMVAKAKRYKVKKLGATPAWANDFFIQEAYSLAKLREKVCGGKWHVDHIVPLRSKLVCGLHVEHNLRVIPALTNQLKSNKYWPDMP